jgi:hypothetical protein
MAANRAWIKRNLGFDPAKITPPPTTFAHKLAAKPGAAPEDLQREIIEFDSEGPEGLAFTAFSTATGLSRFTDIKWPGKLAPITDTNALKGPGGKLPKADVLVVTWTVDEGHALSRVLTPGKDSRNNYVPYKNNFAKIAKKMRKGCPALNAGRLGAYWTTRIGAMSVVVFKSESHMSQDTKKKQPAKGKTLPNEDLWAQIIAEVNPTLVITTGTAGGIGRTCQVGDVVVSPIVRFDGTKWLKRSPYGLSAYRDGTPPRGRLSRVNALFKANAGQLPKDNKRPPKVIISTSNTQSVLTTDFFGFDTSDNRWKLQKKGAVCEMGDAILGLVMSKIKNAPAWVAVRNVSDPQIKAEGTLKDQAHEAAQIYKGFGRWSSVCSAIVCWALIA